MRDINNRIKLLELKVKKNEDMISALQKMIQAQDEIIKSSNKLLSNIIDMLDKLELPNEK